MNLYLTRFGTHTAVIAAGSVSAARTVFTKKVTAVADRTQIRSRVLKGTTHEHANLDGAVPFVVALITD